MGDLITSGVYQQRAAVVAGRLWCCWAVHTQALEQLLQAVKGLWVQGADYSERPVPGKKRVCASWLSFLPPVLAARPLPPPSLWSSPSGFVVSVVCNHCTHPRWFMKTLWNAICQACVQPAACHSAARKTEAGSPFPLAPWIAFTSTRSDVEQENSRSICKQSLLQTPTCKVVGFFTLAQIRYPSQCSFSFPWVCCWGPAEVTNVISVMQCFPFLWWLCWCFLCVLQAVGLIAGTAAFFFFDLNIFRKLRTPRWNK